jgi:hypothetical protein
MTRYERSDGQPLHDDDQRAVFLPPEGGSHEARAGSRQPGEEDGISLKPILITLWGRRWILGGTVAAAMLLFALAAAGLYALAPRERVASIAFRTMFDGSDRGRYPNGTPFSSADVIASPVLTDVFAQNDMERFGPFEDFKNAIFVVDSSPEINMLSYAYEAKLSEPRLTPVMRASLEEEFRRKRESMPVSYSLNFRRTERTKLMPPALMSKVLHDTLATWARHAAQRKGVLKYDVAVLSRNILPASLVETEDYIVIVDILRSKILRTLANIDRVAGLPGANIARTGERKVSLAEVRANLQDVYRFKVQPLIGLIRSTGLSKDPQLAILYLENQLFQNRLDGTEADGRVRTLQNSLRQYMQEDRQLVAAPQQSGQPAEGAPGQPMGTIIPQFGESFLDRLAQMSTQNNDVKFRQDITERVIAEGVKAVALEKDTAYYQDLITSLKGALGRRASGEPPAVRERAGELVKARAAEALDDLLQSLDQVNAIYAQLSADNLNPDTMLYAITAPFSVRATSALNRRAIAFAGIMVFLLSAVAAAFACLGYGYFRREIAGPRATTPSTSDRSLPEAGPRPAGSVAG